MDDNIKRCLTCAVDYPETAEFYYRSSFHKSGFKNKCKKCCKLSEDPQKKIKRTHNSKIRNRARVLLRSKTICYFKQLEKYCSVINCSERTVIDMHHVDYEDALAVIPLCKKHHVMNHNICKNSRGAGL